MKASITIEIDAHLIGSLIHDPETGPDSVEDVYIDCVHIFDKEYSGEEIRKQFGELYDVIVSNAEDEEWYDE